MMRSFPGSGLHRGRADGVRWLYSPTLVLEGEAWLARSRARPLAWLRELRSCGRTDEASCGRLDASMRSRGWLRDAVGWDVSRGRCG